MAPEVVLLALAGGILRLAPALVWATVGDCITQRSGAFNIGIEGIVPVAAVAAVAAAAASGDPYLGVAAACACGMALGLAAALCCLLPRASELVVGISFLVAGIALAQFAGAGHLMTVAPPLPGYDLGAALGAPAGALEVTALLPLILVLAAALGWLGRNTRAGLLVVAAGSPGGGEGLGVVGASARAVRVVATTLGGGFAGVAGAQLALSYPGGWSDNLASGLGITALTLAFIARARPLAAAAVALGFAALAALGLVLQGGFGSAGYHAFNALPYIGALLVLVLVNARRREG